MRSERPHRRPSPAAALLGVFALAVTGCAGSADEESTPAGAATSPTASTASSPAASTPHGPVQVFADFSCPHCATFHATYAGPLHAAAQDGEIELRYRIVDFLGRGDPESWSTRAAQAYYCLEGASDGNAQTLHEYQDWLFDQQTAGRQPGDAELVEQAGGPGGGAGVDIGQCVAQDGGSAKITAALSDFSDAGLRGVPAVYADGTLYDADEHGQLMTWLTGGSLAHG